MNLEINKLDLLPEEIDDFRLQFGQRAPEALARDVVTTLADQDYAPQIQNDPNFFRLNACCVSCASASRS